MTGADKDTRQRNREIAENESNQQVTGDVRVSMWAIAIAVIVGAIAFGFGWLWLHR